MTLRTRRGPSSSSGPRDSSPSGAGRLASMGRDVARCLQDPSWRAAERGLIDLNRAWRDHETPMGEERTQLLWTRPSDAMRQRSTRRQEHRYCARRRRTSCLLRAGSHRAPMADWLRMRTVRPTGAASG